MNNPMTTGEAYLLLDNKIGNLVVSVVELKTTVAKMAETMTNLIRIEQRQLEQAAEIGRAFSELGRERERNDKQDDKFVSLDREQSEKVATLARTQDEKVATLTRDMPSLREMRLWIVGCIGTIAAALLYAVLSGSLVVHFAK